MSKMINTIVDAEGNVNVDFSGFVGDQCLQMEKHLRHGLADLGIKVYQPSKKRKAVDNERSVVNQHIKIKRSHVNSAL